MLRVYRIIPVVILSIFIMLAVPTVQSQGQGNNSEPTHAIPAELPSLPPMAHQPPANAANLDDFTPPGATVIPVDIDLPGGPVTPTIPGPPNPPIPTMTLPITVPASIPLNGQLDNVVKFDEGQVAVVIEKNTIMPNSELLFQPLPVPIFPLTVTNTISDPVDSVRLLHFQLNMAQNGQPLDKFDKPVRIVLDMRSLTGDLNPVYGDNFFLAYEDENEPGLWHDVPIRVHQESGLISAEVTHFSTWVGGSRPERWTPSFVPAVVSEFSGAATYNYPIEVPPGRHGLQPAVSLSYNSRSLDGAIQDIEAGDIANGWSLAQIAIMREKVKVQSDGAHLFIHHNDEFNLVLNGVGHKLEPNPSNNPITDGTIRYYAKNAPGLKVWRYYDATLPTDGLYWVVTTADGVQYRLGYTADSEEYQQGPLWTTPSPTHWGKSNNRSAIAWNVDTVTDPYGNQMQYDYLTDTETETVEDEDDSITVTTRSSRLWRISYNYPNRITALPATKNVARLTSTPATTIHLRATSDNTGAGTFSDPVTHVLLFHNNASNPIKEYRLTNDSQSVQSSGCSRPQGNPRHTKTEVITDIRLHTNTDGDVNTNDMGYALPAVTFEYTSKVHYTHPDVNPDKSCFYFRYLEKVHNGYGGTTTFSYTSDGRDIGTYAYAGGTDTTTWPIMGQHYYVTEVRQNDGRNPDVKTTYAYTSPCYDQWNTSVTTCSLPGAPEHGKLVGFASTTQTRYDYNNNVINKQITTFSQNAATTIGRPTRVDLKDSSNTLLNRTDTSYSTQSIGGIANMFTYVSQTSSTQYANGTGSATLSNKVVYRYDTGPQGGVQYGNVTRIDEYDDANAATSYRTTNRWYYPNISGNHWLVNRVAAESTFNGGTQLGATWTYYDGNNNHQASPSKGSPTRVRHFLTSNDNCNQTPNPPSGCAHYYLTAESSFAYDSYGNQTHQYGSNEYGYQAMDSNWNLLAGAAPATETTTQISYESGFHLYPIQASLSGPGLTTQTTTFQIYGFNGVGLGGFQEQRGLLKQVTEASGIITKYEYDPFGRLYAVYDGYNFSGFGDTNTSNGDPVNRYLYWDNNFNNGVTFLDPANDEPFVSVVVSRPGSYPAPANSSSGYAFNEQTFYDGFGRPIQNRSIWNWISGQSKSREIYSSIDYHANGQAECQTVPYDLAFYSDSPRNLNWPESPFDTTACSSKSHTSTTYDELGRPDVVTAPDGSTTDQDYLIRNNVTLGGYSKLNQVTVYDANTHARSQFSNARGQLVAVREFSGTSPNYSTYATTIYEYDPSGNLDKVTDEANNVTSMTYDHFGRKVSMSDPDMGSWSYSYDAAGNLLTQGDANLDRLCFYYDNLNRLTHKRHDNDNNGCETNDSRLAHYLYFDSGGGLGNPSQIRWGNSNTENRETFAYDSLGRLTTHNRWVDSHLFTMSYSGFDAFHRPTQTTYPDGEVVTTSFDHEGENGLTAGSNALVNGITYNARGQMVFLNRGSGVSNTTYSYFGQNDTAGGGLGDSNYRLKTIQHGSSSDSKSDFNYTYDLVGNIRSNITTYNSTTDAQNFGYDHLNRLTSASATGGVGNYSHAYSYDTIGNLARNGTTTSYSTWHANCGTTPTHDLPHAIKKVNSDYYCYDNNGNMTSRNDGTGDFDQQFDVENRLAKVVNNDTTETARFFYDASGSRVKSIQDDTVIYTPFPNYEEEVPLAYNWHFDEGSGNNIADSAVPKQAGTRQGPAWTSGVSSSQALSFDGSNDYVQFNETIPIEGEMTVSAWVKPEQAPTGKGRLVASTFDHDADLTKRRGWALGRVWGSGDAFYFRIYDANGQYQQANYPTFFNEYLNEWVHVTGVFRPGQAIELYINGQLAASDTSGIPTHIGQSNVFKIGLRADNGSQGQWDGVIDEVQIQAKALSAAEVATLAGQYSPVPTLTFTVNGASSVSVPAGSNITLAWNSNHATSCTASSIMSNWNGNKALNGTQTITASSSAGTYSYLLTCSGVGGSVSKSVQVTVTGNAPTLNFTVDGSSVTTVFPASNVTMAWSSTYASSCTASGNWSGSKALSGSESIIAPSSEGTYGYTLTCTGTSGSVTKTVKVIVTCLFCQAKAVPPLQGDDLLVQANMKTTPKAPISKDIVVVQPSLFARPDGAKAAKPLLSSGSPVIAGATWRSTYFLAGQAIATRVTGDPVSSNNELFFIYADHLGSSSLLAKRGSNANVAGSRTFYLPFGGYRGTAPSQGITDRDFTGQKENMELGLMYYNARYYVPGIGRFASADTIVPDPANPQSYNRYSYVNNRPLNFTDPSGHCAVEGVGLEGGCTPIPTSPTPSQPPEISIQQVFPSPYLHDFLSKIGLDQTYFNIVTHDNNHPDNRSLYRYEMAAWVLAQEHRGFHPNQYEVGTPSHQHFSEIGLFTAAVLIQVPYVRERVYPDLYDNVFKWIQENPDSGQFAYTKGNGAGYQDVYNDFLVIAYLIEAGVMPDFLSIYPNTPTDANPSGEPIFYGHYPEIEGIGTNAGLDTLGISSHWWGRLDYAVTVDDLEQFVVP